MREEKGGADTFSVRAVSLAPFSKESLAPDFIKMDIEGAELLALQGARQLLSGDQAPRMLIEFHGDSLRRAGCSMLREYGYGFHSMKGHVLDGIPEERHVLCIPPQYKA